MKTTRSLNLVKVLALAALAAGLSASRANAQGYSGKFTLPFEARWGEADLPPGDYTFTVDPEKPSLMALICQGNHNAALVMAQGRIEGKVSGSSALIAVLSGGKYRIRALRLADAGLVLEYTLPKAERQIYAQAPQLIRRVPVMMAAK